VWYKYTFGSEGSFTFNIIPINEFYDIDFVVFQSENNNCVDLSSIRCMFTGENVGAPTSDSCLGSTGLSINSIDLNEGPGCQFGDDNYLAALNVMQGDVIYLWVASFGIDNNHNYTIEHGGSAEIDCVPSSINEMEIQENINIYPNPFLNIINFEISDQKGFTGVINLLSLSGQEIHSWNSRQLNKINLDDLNSGAYLIEFVDYKGKSVVKKIVKF
jgi:hypothetical protein